MQSRHFFERTLQVKNDITKSENLRDTCTSLGLSINTVLLSYRTYVRAFLSHGNGGNYCLHFNFYPKCWLNFFKGDIHYFIPGIMTLENLQVYCIFIVHDYVLCTVCSYFKFQISHCALVRSPHTVCLFKGTWQ
jgi:hypothetical protein